MTELDMKYSIISAGITQIFYIVGLFCSELHITLSWISHFRTFKRRNKTPGSNKIKCFQIYYFTYFICPVNWIR